MAYHIPDSVVETALSAYWGVDWTGASNDPDCRHRIESMRRALCVAVKWQNERVSDVITSAHKAAVCYDAAAMKQAKDGRKNMHTGAALSAAIAKLLWPLIMPPDCKDQESCSRHSDCMYLGCSARNASRD